MAKYSKKLVETIAELLENDMSVTDICRAVGITRKTFYEWKSSKSEFAQAVDDARERAYDELIALARRTLRDRIEGYTVEETTFTYEPSSFDETEMVLKKKVVKRKRKEPSITSLNNMIQRIEKKSNDHNNLKDSSSNTPNKGMIIPSNSQEAFTLANFFLKLEQNNTFEKQSKTCSKVSLFEKQVSDITGDKPKISYSNKKQ